MFSPISAEEVSVCLEFCQAHGLPWLALGLGSNVLVSDDGFAGLVLKLGKGFDSVLDRSDDGTVWKVAAGMPTPRLARQTASGGLSGVHKMVGIPGTVGGGIAPDVIRQLRGWNSVRMSLRSRSAGSVRCGNTRSIRLLDLLILGKQLTGKRMVEAYVVAHPDPQRTDHVVA